MQPVEGPINVDDLVGLGYADFTPLESVQIPPSLTGATPTRLEDIYVAFMEWIQGVPNINTHLGNTLDQMEEILYIPQLLALRLSVMSQFYMRHPSYEIYNRR